MKKSEIVYKLISIIVIESMVSVYLIIRTILSHDEKRYVNEYMIRYETDHLFR